MDNFSVFAKKNRKIMMPNFNNRKGTYDARISQE